MFTVHNATRLKVDAALVVRAEPGLVGSIYNLLQIDLLGNLIRYTANPYKFDKFQSKTL